MRRALRSSRGPSALLLAASLAACASRGARDVEDPAGEVRVVESPGDRRSSDMLTRAEIERANVTNLYDAVERLRPAFLRTRSTGSINSPPRYAVVYLDGMRFGGLEALRRINATDVESIRYLRGPDATLRYGTGHEGGALLVQTRR